MQGNQKQYETTVVIDSFSKDDDIKNLTTKVQNFIKNNGGQIDTLEEWGRRRLAYEINRKQYGNYVHILFSGPSALPELLEREYRLEESILRYLTVIADPRAHAETANTESKLSTDDEKVVSTEAPTQTANAKTESQTAERTKEEKVEQQAEPLTSE
ncbi:30S ribosomal protein S6 [bacterium]|nr:30S ribosomal protein S6 [bacterium]